MYKISYLFLVFFIYAIIGYFVEICACSIIEKKIVLNRGFCLGPYLPIYGICCVIMSYFLIRYKQDPFALFITAAFVCTFMEYMTSFILEKIFKARWWDYSEKRFNIEGRVCLENALLFGIGGLACIYLINPMLVGILNKLTEKTLIIIAIIAIIIFLADVIITLITMAQVKIASQKFKNKDITSEITIMIRNQVIKNAALIRHMLNAFPKIDRKRHKDQLASLKAYIESKTKRKKR